MKAIRVIAITFLAVSSVTGKQFDCGRFTSDLQNDESALEQVRNSLLEDKTTAFDMNCLKLMIQNNLFNTTEYLLQAYYFQNYPTNEIYSTVIEGVKSVRTYYDSTLARLQAEKRKPILMRPPFQWAQNLHSIFIEVKYAYRHDVSGCATLQNETVDVTNTHILIRAFCMEQDNFLQFEVAFPFWAEVNATTLKWEYQPVGKHYITVEKMKRPGRWLSLHRNGTDRPPMMKLWFENHQKFHYQLYEFEDDDFETFEGYDLIDVPDEQDTNDMTWLFPQRGPGNFKDKVEKKNKKKSSKKNKGKGASKKKSNQ